MKHAVFMLSYGAPIAVGLVLVDMADPELTIPRLGLLTVVAGMAFMASIGFHFFETHPHRLTMRTSELAIRGALAGVAFLGLSLATFSIGGFRVGFYAAISLSIVLAPLALLIPRRLSRHDCSAKRRCE